MISESPQSNNEKESIPVLFVMKNKMGYEYLQQIPGKEVPTISRIIRALHENWPPEEVEPIVESIQEVDQKIRLLIEEGGIIVNSGSTVLLTEIPTANETEIDRIAKQQRGAMYISPAAHVHVFTNRETKSFNNIHIDGNYYKNVRGGYEVEHISLRTERHMERFARIRFVTHPGDLMGTSQAKNDLSAQIIIPRISTTTLVKSIFNQISEQQFKSME